MLACSAREVKILAYHSAINHRTMNAISAVRARSSPRIAIAKPRRVLGRPAVSMAPALIAVRSGWPTIQPAPAAMPPNNTSPREQSGTSSPTASVQNTVAKVPAPQRFLFISKFGLIHDLAWEVKKEGHDVRYRNAWIKDLDLNEPNTDF